MNISEVHDELSDKQLIFLDSELNPVKVKSIKKVPYKGKIYDVDVPNDIVLVRRHNETTRKPQITQDYTENKENINYSFLFKNLWESVKSRGLLIAICYWNDYN